MNLTRKFKFLIRKLILTKVFMYVVHNELYVNNLFIDEKSF